MVYFSMHLLLKCYYFDCYGKRFFLYLCSMSKAEISKLLEEHGIRPTANRLLVAEALGNEERPLSLLELEDLIGSVDKSGISRCLTLFKENHLVHSIEDVDCTRYHDEDAHVHFYCERCHRTFCLDNIHIPPVELPKGYDPRTSNYLVKGICPECTGYRSA